MIRYILISLLFLVSGCSQKTTVTQSQESQEDYLLKGYESLGVTPVKFEFNPERTFVLASYQDEVAVPGNAPLKVAVIKVTTNEVVYRRNLNNGTVRWISEFIIEVMLPPGMPVDNEVTTLDYTYKVDVRTGEKVKSLKVQITD